MSESHRTSEKELDVDSTKNLAKILRILGHPKRIEILTLLHKSQQEYSVILRNIGISRTALANHLNLLVETGMIQRMERGSYSLTEDGRSFYDSSTRTYFESKARFQLERKQLLETYSFRGKKGGNELVIMKKLKWTPRWVSHMGSIEGTLKFLKQKISTGWLYGGTGHAFILNIHEGLCPSGPTAWVSKMLFELAPNLGYKIAGVFVRKSDSEFPRLQEKAWAHAKQSIDDGIPCYGWELEVPEFYVIKGYDNIGYHYSGPHCDDGKGPKPWNELGISGTGIIEVYSVHPTEAANPKKVIKESFEKAIHHASNPDDIIFPGYRSGLEGYDLWISAIQDGSAVTMGNAYNAAVWAECRKYAVEFLKEANKKLTRDVKPLIDTSLSHYQDVSKNLDLLAKLFPFSPGMSPKPIGVSSKNSDGVEYLTAARNAEEKGLDSLKPIVEALNN